MLSWVVAHFMDNRCGQLKELNLLLYRDQVTRCVQLQGKNSKTRVGSID